MFVWSSLASVPISRQRIKVQITAGRNSLADWNRCSAGSNNVGIEKEA